MDISCKRCSALIPAEDVNVGELVAKCASCDAVFDIRDQVGGEASDARPRAVVELPKGMRVDRVEGSETEGGPYRGASIRGGVTLEWRWFQSKHLFIIGFTAIWWAFLVFWYTIAMAADAPLIMKIFPIVHIAAGVVMGYISLALWRNTTRVTVDGDALHIAHQPFRWPGAKSLPVTKIEQLFCTEGVAYTVNERPVPGYNVHIGMRGGAKVDLVKNLAKPEQALYIEQELERCLGITDRPVAGELAR